MARRTQQSCEDLYQSTSARANEETCLYCGKTFRGGSLKRHMQPKIACPVEACHRSYRRDNKTSFMAHMHRYHPEIESSSCQIYFIVQRMRPVSLPGLCISGAAMRARQTQSSHTSPAQHQHSYMSIHNEGFIDTDAYETSNELDRVSGNMVQLVHPDEISAALQATSDFESLSGTIEFSEPNTTAIVLDLARYIGDDDDDALPPFKPQSPSLAPDLCKRLLRPASAST